MGAKSVDHCKKRVSNWSPRAPKPIFNFDAFYIDFQHLRIFHDLVASFEGTVRLERFKASFSRILSVQQPYLLLKLVKKASFRAREAQIMRFVHVSRTFNFHHLTAS